METLDSTGNHITQLNRQPVFAPHVPMPVRPVPVDHIQT